jgi:hypothetical protein
MEIKAKIDYILLKLKYPQIDDYGALKCYLKLFARSYVDGAL